MARVHVVEHAVLQHHVTQMRNVNTPPAEFRQLVSRVARFLAAEATRDLPVDPITINTPVAVAQGVRLRGRIGVVPILRAGLGMVDGVLDFIPEAQVWHLGVYRDERTALPVEYYSRLPQVSPLDVALVLDPMLATGGSAAAALSGLTARNVGTIRLISIIASADGVARLTREFPTIDIYVAAVDAELNAHKFIVPGLGDAGDRMFNTLS